MVLAFWLAKLTKKAGASVGGQNWQLPRIDLYDRTGQTGLVLYNPNLVRFDLYSPSVTRFGRGTSFPAYKYKSHGRLRSFYPIESIYYFPYFFSNPSFSNLVLFFACLYGIQGHLGWPADSKTRLDLQAPMESLPSLRF